MGDVIVVGNGLVNASCNLEIGGEIRQFGSTFYPAHYDASNTLKMARCVADFFKNSRGAKKDDSKVIDVIRVVAFANKENPEAGRAAVMAGMVSPGCTVNFSLLRESGYMQEVRDRGNNNAVMTYKDGRPVTMKITEYIVVGDINVMRDSRRLVKFEVESGMRPMSWVWGETDDPAYQAHIQTLAQRRAMTWQGGPTYGYARVLQPFKAVTMRYPIEGPITGWFPGLIDTKTKQMQAGRSYGPAGAGFGPGAGAPAFTAPATPANNSGFGQATAPANTGGFGPAATNTPGM